MDPLALAEFEIVTKDYPAGWTGRGRLRALDRVSLRLAAGEVLGLVGPNRAGKTTLLKLLLSLCRATSGQVYRFGVPSSDRRTLGRIGYVHEHPAFPRHLTAAGVLKYGGALSLVPYETVLKRVPALLDRVGLRDRSQEPVSRFSKGMAQRLALAQALINEPDLLVLDEPTEGLDAAGRKLLAGVVRGQQRRNGGVLLVSHVATEVEALCDRVVVLEGGRLSKEAPMPAADTSQAPEPCLEASHA